MKNTQTAIYLDTAATTPMLPEVVEVMQRYLGLEGCFANPSSGHSWGREAADAVESARRTVAREFGCEADEVIFTSGATEANTLAIHGTARAYAAHGKHIITTAIEHKAVKDSCHALEREGFAVAYLKPNRAGWVEPETLQAALRDDTILVSIMHCNNETGVLQPIEQLGEVVAEHGCFFHVDAAQSAGKFAINTDDLQIDMLSLSAHKFYGPKGIGCLVLKNRKKRKLSPLLFGGKQEYGIRPGTVATQQVVALAKALDLCAIHRSEDLQLMAEHKSYFVEILKNSLPVTVHGEQSRCSPYILNFSIDNVGSDALLNQLTEQVALSSGSACSSGVVEPSAVLRAMGIEGDLLYGAVRASFGRFHTRLDIKRAATWIVESAVKLRAML